MLIARFRWGILFSGSNVDGVFDVACASKAPFQAFWSNFPTDTLTTTVHVAILVGLDGTSVGSLVRGVILKISVPTLTAVSSYNGQFCIPSAGTSCSGVASRRRCGLMMQPSHNFTIGMTQVGPVTSWITADNHFEQVQKFWAYTESPFSTVLSLVELSWTNFCQNCMVMLDSFIHIWL